MLSASTERNRIYEKILEYIRGDFRVYPFENSTVSETEQIFSCLKDNKLTTIIHDCSIAVLPELLNKMLEIDYQRYAVKASKTYTLLEELATDFYKSRVYVTLIKGIALSDIIYGSIFTRPAGDIDLLIEPTDILKVDSVLRKRNFSQRGIQTIASSEFRQFSIAYSNNPIKHSSPFPVKKSHDSNQYGSYYRYTEDCSEIIEIHDGLYYLDSSFISSFIWSSACDNPSPVYNSLDLYHTLLLLFLNTYENSESIISNVCDHEIYLRDYVDLRFFFRRYGEQMDWGKVFSLAKKYGIYSLICIVLNNLFEIYRRDVSNGCADYFTPRAGHYSASLVERIMNSDQARIEGSRFFRRNLLKKCEKDIQVKLSRGRLIDKQKYFECKSYRDVLHSIERSAHSFFIFFSILIKMMKWHKQFVFQCEFFPMHENELGYLSYKVQLYKDMDEYISLGHRSYRCLNAVRLKNEGDKLECSSATHQNRIIVRIELPFEALGFGSCPGSQHLCYSADACKHHFANAYHKAKNVGYLDDLRCLKIEKLT